MSTNEAVSVEEMVSELDYYLSQEQFRDTVIIVNPERLTAARDYIIEAAKVLGPKCPKCGHFLKSDHMLGKSPHRYQTNTFVHCKACQRKQGHGAVLCYYGETSAEFCANHPAIAADLGVTP